MEICRTDKRHMKRLERKIEHIRFNKIAGKSLFMAACNFKYRMIKSVNDYCKSCVVPKPHDKKKTKLFNGYNDKPNRVNNTVSWGMTIKHGRALQDVQRILDKKSVNCDKS